MRSRLQLEKLKSQPDILLSIFQNFTDSNDSNLPFNTRHSLAKNDDWAYSMRGRKYYYLREYRAAVEDVNKAIALAPEEPIYYIYRSDAKDAMGYTEEAKADKAKAYSLDKDI